MRSTRPAALLLAAALVGMACTEEPPPAPAPAPPTDVEVLRERVAAQPDDADAWLHLAGVYDRISLYEDEADALRRVVALRPADGSVYVKLGTTYGRLGRHQEAVEAFSRAERTVKDQPVLYNNLAISYGKVGRTSDEIAALRKAIALRPRYAVARFNLGMALLRKGDRAGAAKELRALEEFDEGAAASLRKAIEAAPGERRRS